LANSEPNDIEVVPDDPPGPTDESFRSSGCFRRSAGYADAVSLLAILGNPLN
jgi:hypothetical protein